MKDFIGVGLVLLLIAAFLSMIWGIGYAIGYKGGQIDAINGKIKYHLVEQNDKSLEWKRIPAKDTR